MAALRLAFCWLFALAVPENCFSKMKTHSAVQVNCEQREQVLRLRKYKLVADIYVLPIALEALQPDLNALSSSHPHLHLHHWMSLRWDFHHHHYYVIFFSSSQRQWDVKLSKSVRNCKLVANDIIEINIFKEAKSLDVLFAETVTI